MRLPLTEGLGTRVEAPGLGGVCGPCSVDSTPWCVGSGWNLAPRCPGHVTLQQRRPSHVCPSPLCQRRSDLKPAASQRALCPAQPCHPQAHLCFVYKPYRGVGTCGLMSFQQGLFLLKGTVHTLGCRRPREAPGGGEATVTLLTLVSPPYLHRGRPCGAPKDQPTFDPWCFLPCVSVRRDASSDSVHRLGQNRPIQILSWASS